MTLRIRQIVLAARDLSGAVAEVQNKLHLDVAYRDPEVAKFGLANAIFVIGDQFLEIVAPTRADTAAGRHLDRLGDSAYMLILQTDDFARDRQRLTQLGVRVVWEANHADIRAVHLHPKDIGAAIVSLDEATPRESWRWAGPNWQRNDAGRVVGVTIAARDPAALAARWAQVLELEPPRAIDDAWRLDLDGGALTFVQSGNDADHIVAFGFETLQGAAPVTIGGTKFEVRNTGAK